MLVYVHRDFLNLQRSEQNTFGLRSSHVPLCDIFACMYLHHRCARRLEKELRKDKEDFLQIMNEDDLKTAHREALQEAAEGEVSLQ